MALKISLANASARTLSDGTLSIGRSDRNDWVLPDPDRHLSKTHCVISVENGQYVLTDLSTNGVHINGARQPTSRDSRTILTDGDTFRIGEYTFSVDEVAARPEARPASTERVDPLDIDPLDDPLGRPVAPAAGQHPSFAHPLPYTPPAFRPSDPFDTADTEAQRSHRSFDGSPDGPLDQHLPGIGGGQDRFNGATPGVSWSGPVQADHTDAPGHAFRAPRVVSSAAELSPMDFDALIGDLSALGPADAPPPARPGPAAPWPPTAAVRDPFAELDDLIQPPAAVPPASPAPAPPAPPLRAPAATAPVPPVAAPQAVASPAAAEGPSAQMALQAFLEAAGVPNAPVGADPVAAMRAAGQVFRALTEGVREVLMSRTAIKGELRVEQTMMRSANNNPLKFSFSPDDAVTALLGPTRPGYMAPLKAAREACDDIKTHEIAVMAGVQTALMGLLARFDPATLESRLTTGVIAAMLPAARKARLWESFRELHGTIASEAEDDFQAVFGRAFAKAYNAQSKKD